LVIYCFSGKGVYGFLTGSKGRAFGFPKNLPLSRLLQLFLEAGERIFLKNLDNPKTYTDNCPKQ